MDAAKKAALEKRVVIGLAGLFVATFLIGPMRNMGWFAPPRPTVPAETPSGKVHMTQSLETVLTDRLKRMEPDPIAAEPPPAAPEAATAPAAYTAQTLRDPFKSLLPENAPAAGANGQTLAVGPNQIPVKGPAPALRIQGLLWGGVKPQAIINNRVYGIDEQIEGAKIVSIDRHGVMVDYLGARLFYTPSSAGMPQWDGPQTHQWR